MGQNVYTRRRRRVTTTYLEDTSEGQNEAGACAYEEDGGDIEAKCNGSIGKEDKGADACKLEEGLEAFRKGQDGEIDEGADGRVVVERDEGIHLETVQEDLDHYETRSLELCLFCACAIRTTANGRLGQCGAK
jgi:hypothetical protein